MYTISKKFAFSASHQLTKLPNDHQCSRLHGHNYEVELILRRAALDENGFVVDYGDLKPFGDYLQNTFEHRHINNVIEVPTAENIAKHLYNLAWNLWHDVAIIVRVSETPKTWAEYSQ